MHFDIIIIGAGISGVTLAQHLTAAGKRTLVLDKGRGVGGRMSTRRREGVRYDHGAQFITVRDERVQKMFERLVADGVVREWFRASSDGLPRFCGVHGMSSIVAAVAAGSDVRTSMEVASLEHDGTLWTVRCADGSNFTANAIVSSAPVPQTVQLLSNGNVVLNERVYAVLATITYEHCIASLVRTTSPHDVRAVAHPDIAYIGDNSDKGISESPAYTIHATPQFSERMWDADRSEVAKHLAACVFGGALEGVTDIDVHAWKFSRPITTTETTFLRAVDHPPLIVIGDAFGGSRVEGAIISALDAAEDILKR